jgi:hypothetical protein
MSYRKLAHPAQDGIFGLVGVKVSGLLSKFVGVDYCENQETIGLLVVGTGEANSPLRKPWRLTMTVPLGTKDFRTLRIVLFNQMKDLPVY